MRKRADVDIGPFGKHDKMDAHPDEGETIPFTPGGVIGRGTWESEREQETSFGGTSQRKEVLKEHVKVLYHVLSGTNRPNPRSIPY